MRGGGQHGAGKRGERQHGNTKGGYHLHQILSRRRLQAGPTDADVSRARSLVADRPDQDSVFLALRGARPASTSSRMRHNSINIRRKANAVFAKENDAGL
jgi:hypothetical protein